MKIGDEPGEVRGIKSKFGLTTGLLGYLFSPDLEPALSLLWR